MAKLAGASLVLLLALGNAQGQTSPHVVLRASFELTLRTQASTGSVTNVDIATKDLIRAIGDATTNRFSSRARLLLLFKVGGGVPFFIIRDGTNDVNAGAFLTATQIGDPITDLRTNADGLVTGAIHVTEGFRLVNIPAWGFQVQGFNEALQSNHATGKSFLSAPGPTSLTVSGSGAGNVAGAPAVVQASVTALRQDIESYAE
jgi:hypothetical protein